MNTDIEIRSYTWNGASWEWNGDGWDADPRAHSPKHALRLSATDGDWSAYKTDELCRLAAFADDGELLDEMIFTPHPAD